MILTICYNNSCNKFLSDVTTFCLEEKPDLKVVTYDENHYKERKKAFKLKGGYSARMTPFMLLTQDDNTYVKAFYSEDKSCTVNNLKIILNTLNNESTSN